MGAALVSESEERGLAESRMAMATALGAEVGVTPPVVTRLRPLLGSLPGTLDPGRACALAGLDAEALGAATDAGIGPRLVLRVAGRPVYLTAYFLEWLEGDGFDATLIAGAALRTEGDA